ncbi:MAG TPA: ThiF family adenylyltransferase [Gaiellales bacterium]|jgi:molybdopterin/thiamine biosynthesis adenylyltransferase
MAEPSQTPISNQVIPRLPRLRSGLSVVPGDGETVIFSPRLESVEAIEDPDGVWACLLASCDGSRGPGAVQARMAETGFDLSADDVAEGIDALVAQGLLVDAFADVSDEWANQRAYIEQLTRGTLDVSLAQARVRSTRVLVLGAGGTGSWLALSLAMMGVASLMMVDADVVEARNRTRQPYPADSVGRRKVEVLGELVSGLRPDIEYSGVDLRVEHEEDLSALVGGIDVVACCADEPSLDAIASIIAGVCVPAEVPHIVCGYHGASGRVGPFWFPRRRPLPCPGCNSLLNDTDYGTRGLGLRDRRMPTPVSVAQPQLVASLAASEILHFRAGVRPATAGRMFALDSLTLDSRRVRVPLRDDCRICFGGRKRHVSVSSPVAGVERAKEVNL